MDNLYEYLIGGRKTGTRNKPKQFKELVPGDHYIYITSILVGNVPILLIL